MKNPAIVNLHIDTLLSGYRRGEFTPSDVIREVHRRSASEQFSTVWISLLELDAVLAYAEALSGRDISELPLYGVPFAIKDNIDLAGISTTAGCPDYAYSPEKSAFTVERLIAAGAIPVGKTNLDQFATGLVGTRSPYGVAPNSYDRDYIPGGSSSGSASAVAHELVSFALGTDTAGSGRVPAAFNNLVGWKPTRGVVSTGGVVPACRSLDCVSVFALSVADIERIAPVVAADDPADAWSRPFPGSVSTQPSRQLNYGVPHKTLLKFFGNQDYEKLFEKAVKRMESLGYRMVEIDAAPFIQAAELLYQGPWVTERYAAIEDFLKETPGSIWPATRTIISKGADYSALDLFRAEYKLAEYRKQSAKVWEEIDFLLMPTVGTAYTIAEVEAEPVQLNSNLGYYTNFMNLLDLSALALPAGFTPGNFPFGITICAPAFKDDLLMSIGSRWSHAHPGKHAEVAVCGAHLSGFSLNYQLVERGARLSGTICTAPEYRFYRLPGNPPKPGLVRVKENGVKVEVEVWKIPETELGGFLTVIPSPLGLGKIKLEDGRLVTGFLAESLGLEGAEDISRFGSWRKAMGGGVLTTGMKK